MEPYSNYHERKWKGFPVLRQVIENEGVPGQYSALTSLSFSFFEHLTFAAEVAILVHEFKKNVVTKAQSSNEEDKKGMQNDLHELEDTLQNFRGFFDDAIKEVRHLRETL